MSFNLIIGLLTTVVSAVMALQLLNRYRLRGGMHLLLWGLGLVLYFIAGITEVLLSFGWSDLAFRMWYWAGALLVPPVLGQGTLQHIDRSGGSSGSGQPGVDAIASAQPGQLHPRQ